jgi:hypothetical protein
MNVQKKGVGKQLIGKAEIEIPKVSPTAGLDLEMTPDYDAAQRPHILRGYAPGGRGPWCKGHDLKHGEEITVDENLALTLTKELK